MNGKQQSEVVSFRSPKTLVASLEKMAKAENRTKANLIVHLLSEAMKRVTGGHGQ